ncbi:OB-fold-containig protein [Pseudaminobacter soli (ex Li et al. 2025)]|uniref:DUF1449 domain-containing protein n=1 Tax=Pseudaminobacter soli (ex Li et al. 2025) TaxID=1295366 RepID=A0A2P7S3Q0_9HYPH|nr:OB-fold-containig protein [Mesorhizobium soli]PSJ57102.1 hypothetical protein C7I85_22985 [Mesorhizobium soli]
MTGFLGAPALYLYPLLAGLLLGVLQIVLFIVGAAQVGHGAGGGVADMFEGSHLGEVFDWLNFGRVPFSVLAMLLLVVFGAAGIALFQLLPSLPIWSYAIAAAPASVLVTQYVGGWIARVLPQDESYAVNHEQLIGRRGVVTLGPLDDGPPGSVRVRDEHGELHTIRARPADAGGRIDKGAEVVVVEAAPQPGRIYLVMPFEEEG